MQHVLGEAGHCAPHSSCETAYDHGDGLAKLRLDGDRTLRDKLEGLIRGIWHLAENDQPVKKGYLEPTKDQKKGTVIAVANDRNVATRNVPSRFHKNG